MALSRATFAKLSPHAYLVANLEPSSPDTPAARSNGRAPAECRPLAVNLSSLSHGLGSAVVRMGDTTAICGVRGETLLTANIPNHRALNVDTELMDYDLIVPNVELATGCAPEFSLHGPSPLLAQTLSSRLYSLVHSTKLLCPDDLRIWHTPPSFDTGADQAPSIDDEANPDEAKSRHVAAYWVLYIDVLFISFDGNAMDAAWAATMAALRDTKIPIAHYDADKELVICSRDDPKPLTLNGFPVACTAAIFTGRETDRPSDGKHWLLMDPDRLEESLCDESVTMVVDGKEDAMRILYVSKHGGTTLSPSVLASAEFLAWAGRRWEHVSTTITDGNADIEMDAK